jgi:hypothetical protein
MRKLLFLSISFFIISCSSNEDKIQKGNLKGICFYNPDLKESLYFYDNKVKYKIWSDYPGNENSSILSEEFVNYSIDENSLKGLINGNEFTIGVINSNKPITYLNYNGSNYMYDSYFSDEPNKNISTLILFVFLILFIFLFFILYKFIKISDLKRKQMISKIKYYFELLHFLIKRKKKQILIVVGFIIGCFIISFLTKTYYQIESINNEIIKNENKSTSDQKNSNENIIKKEIGCSGFGNEGCINEVREHFGKTSVRILGEQYLGDGIFGISFLDPLMGEAYNSRVTTDCNCKVLNVNISIMR